MALDAVLLGYHISIQVKSDVLSINELSKMRPHALINIQYSWQYIEEICFIHACRLFY